MNRVNAAIPVAFPRLAAHLFSDFERALRPEGVSFAPTKNNRIPIDVEETDNSYIVRASVPGVADDRIEVTFDRDTLVIGVSEPEQESREQGEGRFLARERQAVRGTRSIRFPVSLVGDDVQAEKKDGVLTIYLRKEGEKGSKRVAVRSV